MSQLTVDSLDDVILTADDIEMCSDNVTQCTASVKVSYKNDSVFFSVGGDVPSGTDHLGLSNTAILRPTGALRLAGE